MVLVTNMAYFVANCHISLAHIMCVAKICPLTPVDQCHTMETFYSVSSAGFKSLLEEMSAVPWDLHVKRSSVL